MKKPDVKQYLWPFTIIIPLVMLDAITKYLIVSRFGSLMNDRIDMLGGFLRISLVYNDGFVFGMGQGYKHVALIISLVVLALMIGYYIIEKNKTTLFKTAMALIASGAIGNIIDRLVPGRPGVVDFISMGVDGIYRWPSYNVADFSIVIGAFLLVYVFYREEKKRKRNAA